MLRSLHLVNVVLLRPNTGVYLSVFKFIYVYFQTVFSSIIRTAFPSIFRYIKVSKFFSCRNSNSVFRSVKWL